MTVSKFSFPSRWRGSAGASGVDRALQDVVTFQPVSRIRSDVDSTEEVENLSALEVLVY